MITDRLRTVTRERFATAVFCKITRRGPDGPDHTEMTSALLS